jgi:hypothetical protein
LAAMPTVVAMAAISNGSHHFPRSNSISRPIFTNLPFQKGLIHTGHTPDEFEGWLEWS